MGDRINWYLCNISEDHNAFYCLYLPLCEVSIYPKYYKTISDKCSDTPEVTFVAYKCTKPIIVLWTDHDKAPHVPKVYRCIIDNKEY